MSQPFNGNKQQLLLSYLISSEETFVLCHPIIKPEYFNPELRQAVEYIQAYFDDYHNLPSPEQIKADTDVDIVKQHVSDDQLKYTTAEIEKFCKQKAIVQIALKINDYIETEKYGDLEQEMRNALTITTNRDIGIDVFKDASKMIDLMMVEHDPISCLMPSLDELLFGGMNRKQLHLVAANSGGGKSVMLTNLGLNFCQQGLDVAYISFELDEDIVFLRTACILSGQGAKDWKANKDEIGNQIEIADDSYGNFAIKRMPSGTTPNQVRAYLKEYELYHKKSPDVLVIDYIDIMHPDSKMDLANVSARDKEVTERLRDMLIEFNMIGLSACQQNREAIKASKPDQSHVAGGITKINTTDVYASIISNDAMKAAGEIGLLLLKTRNSDGVGKLIYLSWDQVTLKISDNGRKPPTMLTVDGGEVINKDTGEVLAETLDESPDAQISSSMSLMSLLDKTANVDNPTVTGIID